LKDSRRINIGEGERTITASTPPKTIIVQRLTPKAFEPYGEVIGPSETPPVTMPEILAGGTAHFGRHAGTPPVGFGTDDLNILHLWDPRVTFALGGEPPGIRYMVVHARPLHFHIMERHLVGSQTFIPIGGRPAVFAVAPPANLDQQEAIPDPNTVEAFYLDGSCAVNIRPGTWHWTPIPARAEDVPFVTLTRAKVRLDDMWMVDLAQQLGVTFELILPEEFRE
jgi:ureidoglycolate lyase